MRTRDALLRHLWQTVIDVQLDEATLQSDIHYAEDHPGRPFTQAGAIIGRLLKSGISASDICAIRREAAYRAVFSTLYALDDPGVDGDDVLMLHESLLGADPSGREGR